MPTAGHPYTFWVLCNELIRQALVEIVGEFSTIPSIYRTARNLRVTSTALLTQAEELYKLYTSPFLTSLQQRGELRYVVGAIVIVLFTGCLALRQASQINETSRWYWDAECAGVAFKHGEYFLAFYAALLYLLNG
ncbi:hypothetical protein B0T22DRAFT_476262 [Podospora appendiculata]|uniref:Uncharacterized protein n=1 Tax=Podospora appendiculata TaxID=314037 RepID=A0AAE1CGF6_9PEZI|nr:hypothetical protein B0T22DRAFT_476262 [Podospora appendiculata]